MFYKISAWTYAVYIILTIVTAWLFMGGAAPVIFSSLWYSNLILTVFAVLILEAFLGYFLYSAAHLQKKKRISMRTNVAHAMTLVIYALFLLVTIYYGWQAIETYPIPESANVSPMAEGIGKMILSIIYIGSYVVNLLILTVSFLLLVTSNHLTSREGDESKRSVAEFSVGTQETTNVFFVLSVILHLLYLIAALVILLPFILTELTEGIQSIGVTLFHLIFFFGFFTSLVYFTYTAVRFVKQEKVARISRVTHSISSIITPLYLVSVGLPIIVHTSGVPPIFQSLLMLMVIINAGVLYSCRRWSISRV